MTWLRVTVLLLAALAAVPGARAGDGASAGASARTAPAGNVEAGRAEFARCQWCHQAGPSARSGFGPQLTGIVGRRAGAATDYNYSAAMKNSGIVWTAPMLAAFVKAPQKVVPDNKMRFWGIADEQRIANLLAYLRTL
ncbi:c-type cytochrome [Pseudoduganella rivuli]|uniref:c-type cytochrome n=1 Tax=Pseudoduganella rivuli TaxID=2666085 RepID=UPI003530D2B4